MRRFICAALAALYLTIPALAVETLPEESFSLSCTAAVLMERQTGTVLYEKEAHRHLSPASVTKVMTLLLVAEAVESGAVSPDDPVTASRRAASMGGSQVWLEEGEVMTVAEMTKCVAVVSANDCAVALAEALCGSEEAFVARMNRRAEELGLSESGLARLIRSAYALLGLQSYFTSGETETRAWTIPVGAKAPQAAGVIHSDFERGFIKAETASFEDYVSLGGEKGCRDAGKLRQEGKEYVVQDGDVMHFKFNV